MSVLRSKGYDGASLNELAGSSGLQKASLYHRYPGGKKEIALAVLNFVDQWVDTNITAVLIDQEILPSERLEIALKNIDAIYNSGKCACILRALSMDNGLGLFAEELKTGMEQWISSFTTLGLSFGFGEDKSKEKAINVLVKVQGSLIVSQTLGNTEPFARALADIKVMYLKG